jgi:hypothetical protein
MFFLAFFGTLKNRFNLFYFNYLDGIYWDMCAQCAGFSHVFVSFWQMSGYKRLRKKGPFSSQEPERHTSGAEALLILGALCRGSELIRKLPAAVAPLSRAAVLAASTPPAEAVCGPGGPHDSRPGGRRY